MAEDDPEVTISRAERLSLPRTLDSMRVARLKSFKTRITEWAKPSATVMEEPIIVTIKEKRFRTVGERKIEWYDTFTFDHFHQDVVQFEDLIAHKKGARYKVTVKDATLAYCIVFSWARKSVITGFLRTFPEWKDVKVETVGEALSRLVAEKYIATITVPPRKVPPPPYYIPRPPEEALYHMEPDVKEKLIRKLHWWEK